MFTTLKAAKAGAKRLQSAFSESGYPQKLTLCQEILAKTCGYNNWPHLSKTIGTKHAPKPADQPMALFTAATQAAAPRQAQLNVDGLFAAAFRYDTKTDESFEQRLSELVRQLPGAEMRHEFRHEGPYSRDSHKTVRRRVMPFKHERVKHGEITVDVGLDYETADEELPIRNVFAGLWSGKEMVGIARGTLLAPKSGKYHIGLDYAADIGDHKSDDLVWSILNLGREAGEDVFSYGVLLLWSWCLAPAYRGHGIGRPFLDDVLGGLKKSYKHLEILAIDSSDPGELDFAGEPSASAIKPAAARRLRTYLDRLWIDGFGPWGRIVLYDNSRQGGTYQTMMTMGKIYKKIMPADEMMPEQEAMDVFARAMVRNDIIGKFTQKGPQQPRPLTMDEFPKGYASFAVSMGAHFKPYEYMINCLPAELAEIRVRFNPPDITFRRPTVSAPLHQVMLNCRNGGILVLDHGDLSTPAVDPAKIEALNRQTPKSKCAPDWALGDLYATLATNLRLMFTVDRLETDLVPCAATITIPGDAKPVTLQEVGYWPEGTDGAAVLAEVRKIHASRASERADALKSLAAQILADGFMEREMYHDTLNGAPIIRQRFHRTPWKDPGALTFKAIISKLSPAQSGSPAHESYLERLSAFLAGFIEADVALGLSRFPEVMDLLESEFVPGMGLPRAIEAAPCLPGLWNWWRKTHDTLYREAQSLNLSDLAGGARKTG